MNFPVREAGAKRKRISYNHFMEPRVKTFEMLDDATAEMLRKKTGEERLAMAFDMWVFARDLIRGGIEREHPNWTAEEVQSHLAWRMSHGAVGTPPQTGGNA